MSEKKKVSVKCFKEISTNTRNEIIIEAIAVETGIW